MICTGSERMFYLVFTCVIFLQVLVGALPVDSTCGQSPMNVYSTKGVYIEALHKSRVVLSNLQKDFDGGHEFKFDFKTTSPNGVVFIMTKSDHDDVIALDIVDGNPRYHIRCRHITAILTLTHVRVDDGEWHSIMYRRRYSRGTLFIDNTRYFHNYRLKCSGFDSLTLGGTDPSDDLQAKRLRNLLNTQQGHFEGCVRSVDISTGVGSTPKYVGVSECS